MDKWDEDYIDGLNERCNNVIYNILKKAAVEIAKACGTEYYCYEIDLLRDKIDFNLYQHYSDDWLDTFTLDITKVSEADRTIINEYLTEHERFLGQPGSCLFYTESLMKKYGQIDALPIRK